MMQNRNRFFLLSTVLLGSLWAAPVNAGFEWVPPPNNYAPPPSYVPPSQAPPVVPAPMTVAPPPAVNVPAIDPVEIKSSIFSAEAVAVSPAPMMAPTSGFTAPKSMSSEGAVVPVVPTDMKMRPFMKSNYVQRPAINAAPAPLAPPPMETAPSLFNASPNVDWIQTPPAPSASAVPASSGLKINPFPLGQQSIQSATMEAATAAPIPTDTFDITEGFGSDMPLALAISQVVPANYGYAFRGNVNMGKRVSWSGGKPWNTVLQDILKPLGLQALISDKTVTIVSQSV